MSRGAKNFMEQASRTKKGATGKTVRSQNSESKNQPPPLSMIPPEDRKGVAQPSLWMCSAGIVGGIGDAIGTSLDKGDEVDALLKLPPDMRDALIKRAKDGEKVSAKTEGKKVKREQREIELAG